MRGYQGDDLAASDRIAACVKHFVGYGAAEGGRDYNTTVISPSLLHNVYLPSFHAAVDAGVATLMTAFNDVNGVPCSANPHLLNDILRDEWGFDGFVVSDWESIREMIAHGFAADGQRRGAALGAGGREHGHGEPDVSREPREAGGSGRGAGVGGRRTGELKCCG